MPDEIDPLEAANNSKESQDIAREAAAPAPKSAATPSFKEAFASARKAGDSTFEWNGKKFTTELATSAPAKKAAPKAEPKTEAPAPKAAPKTESKTEAPATKAEAPAPAPKKEYYRDLSGKSREKEAGPKGPDIGGAISRGVSNFFGSIRERGKQSNPDAYAKGGMTASKRADGIASRGKTRGRIC